MSELKEVMNVMQVSGESIPSGYYKKSEADKVIAHQKYKRCLAMAGSCEIGISYWDDDEQEGGWEYQKLRHYIRWKKRWLELAEKFKEAKHG